MSSVPVQQGLLPLLVGDATPLVAQGHWRRGSCLRRMAGESYRRFWSLPCPQEPVCLPWASRLEKFSLQMPWVRGNQGLSKAPEDVVCSHRRQSPSEFLPQWDAGVGGRMRSGKLLEERAHRTHLPWPPCSCSTLLPWLPASRPEHPTQGPGICSPLHPTNLFPP